MSLFNRVASSITSFTQPVITPMILLLATASVAFAENAGPESAPSAPMTTPDAPAGGPAAASGMGSMMPSILLMVGIFAFMYFVLIRPQRKEEKKRKEMLTALKRGDKVVTIGGVHGSVDTIGEQTIDVRIGNGNDTLVVTFNKGAVNATVTTDGAADKSGKK